MTITNNPISSGASFTLDMGKDSATGNQVQKVFQAEPAGGTFIIPAQDGTDGTGITQPTGGVGIRGWLSGAYSVLQSILAAAQGSIPAGSSLIGKVGIDQTTPGLTNLVAVSLPANTPASEVSGPVGNTAIAASIPAVAGQYSYLSNVWIAGLGATTGSTVTCNITNILSSNATGNTWSFYLVVPTGATVPISNGPLVYNFDPPLQSKAINTALQVNVGAFGAGNTAQTVGVSGYNSPSAQYFL